MTVNNSNPSVEYIGNAVLLEFAYNFRIDADTDLQVLVDEIDQVQYTDYTLINQTENGGDVLFAVAPADGAVILIVRFTSRTQQVDYEPFDAFPAETHEWALDKLTMIVQELDLEIKTGGEYDPIVLSVFGRIGNVVAQCSDYAHCYADIDNVVDLVSDQTVEGEKTWLNDAWFNQNLYVGNDKLLEVDDFGLMVEGNQVCTLKFSSNSKISFERGSEIFKINIANDDALTVDLGFVGIFNNNPNYKLDVTGDINTNGGIYRIDGVPLALNDLGDVDLENNALAQGQGIWWDEVHMTWENRVAASESWPTGLNDGGALNITDAAGNESPAGAPPYDNIQVIGGVGIITDSYTDPSGPPVLTGLLWDTMNTPITIAPAVAGSIVWFTLANTGVPAVPPDVGGIAMFVAEIHQYAQAPSPQLSKEEIPVGFAVHNGVIWREASNPKVINQSSETLREFVTTVAPLTTIIEGGDTSQLPSFELAIAAGTVWQNNVDWHNDKADPNREPLVAASPIQFQYTNRDFTDVGVLTPTIDPSMYDNAGTVEAVPGPANATTIQRLYLDPTQTFYWVLWGQNVYPNFLTAQANISADDAKTVVPYLLQQSLLLGYAVCEKAKMDWDVDEAVWIPAGGSGAGSGGGGTPITDHNNLNQRDAATAHPITAITNFQNISSEVLNDGMYWNGATWELGRRTKAIGNFVQGNTYLKGDEVFNGSDVSECRLDGTTSEPFVSGIGTPAYLYVGVGMVNNAQLASQIIFGNRYSNPDQPLYITGYRVNVVAGNAYSVRSVGDPLGSPIQTELVSFTASVTGWVEFAMNPVPIVTGDIFDLVCTVKEPDPTPVTVTALYNYLTPQNAADPLAGEIQHGRSQQDQMRISYTDDNAIDRTALIQGLSIGDQISDGIIDWAVQSNSDSGTFGVIGVAPANVSAANIKNFDFETVTATPISVPSDPAYWATSPTPFIEGLIAVDLPYSSIATNTNAYGVDILTQPAYVPDSAEWFLKIIAG